MALDLGAITDIIIVEHPGDQSVKFHCRRSDPHLLSKLYKKHKTTRTTRKGTETDVEAGAFQEDQFIKTVVDWENVVDGKQALECNEANKRRVFQKANNIAVFILEEVKRIEDDELEYQEKNLKDG